MASTPPPRPASTTSRRRWPSRWRPFNIRVNAILPGSVRTEDYEDASGGDDEYFAKMAENEPLKRLGKEEDFGAAAVYLASDASSWVTGTLLMVAGHP